MDLWVSVGMEGEKNELIVKARGAEGEKGFNAEAQRARRTQSSFVCGGRAFIAYLRFVKGGR